MGFGDTSKKDKANAKAAAEAAAAAAAAEDEEWAQGGKKANKKKEAEEAKRQAKAERKAEADELAAAEEAEASAPKKKDKSKEKKLTRAEIAAKAMAKLQEAEKADKKKKKDIEDSGGNEYIGVLAPNENKSDTISGSGLDDALGALTVASGGASSSGAGGKVNMKAAFAAFEEREIARLKEENPGLKLSQYKERAFKAWEKSPENPANQAVELS